MLAHLSILVLATAVSLLAGMKTIMPMKPTATATSGLTTLNLQLRNYGPSARYVRTGGSPRTLIDAAPTIVELKVSEPKIPEDIQVSSKLSEVEGIKQDVNLKRKESEQQQLAENRLMFVKQKARKLAEIRAAELNEISTTPLLTIPTAKESKPVVNEVNPLSNEEQMRLKVQEEYISRGKRSQELVQLQSALSKSMEKKREMELAIIVEVKSLVSRIQEEAAKEAERVEKLSATVVSIQGVLAANTASVEKETATLVMMKDVRGKIAEDTVANSMDTAIAKKNELIEIEKRICIDIASCVTNLEAEIVDTNSKIASMKALVAKMPLSQDSTEALSYTWNDVELLQNQLSASVATASTRDDKVREFMLVFDRASAQKQAVLGESERQLPGQPVLSRQTAAVRKMDYSIVKSNDELTRLTTKALQTAIASSLIMSLSLLEASFKFAKSSDGKESQEAVVVSLSAASEVAKNAGLALKATQEAWESGYSAMMPDEEIPTIPDYASAITKGVQSVLNSEKVKRAFSGISLGAKTSTAETAKASGLFVRRVSEELTVSSRWGPAVNDFKESLEILGAVATMVGGRLLSESTRKS